jgi:hypothetical protein
VNVKASAGGIIDVSGKATNSDVAITSGGILKAADLYTRIRLKLALLQEESEIHATTLVDAK